MVECSSADLCNVGSVCEVCGFILSFVLMLCGNDGPHCNLD